MKLLITGANGFVGRALCGQLRFLGHEVVAATRNLSADSFIAVGEIDAQTNWEAALKNVDCVIHLAARVHVMREVTQNPLAEFRKTNVEGTLQLARQAAKNGVRRFIFVSSIKVNGEGTTGKAAFSEQNTPAPEDAYGISKAEAEEALKEISLSAAQKTQMEVVIIRPPLIYGAGVKGNFSTMISWVKKGIPLPFSAVKNHRSLLALDNLVDFIALCADIEKSPKAANQLFLLADNEDISTTVLLQKIAQAYQVKSRLLKIPVPFMQFFARLIGKNALADRLLGSLQISNQKARELLGWKPVVTMDEQLLKMAKEDSAT